MGDLNFSGDIYMDQKSGSPFTPAKQGGQVGIPLNHRAQHLTTRQLAQEAWDHQRARQKPLSRLLYRTGVYRVYPDGDIFRPLLRWWHPVAWLLWIALLPVALVVPLFTTFTIISIYGEFSCRPVRYFRDNPDDLFFVK